MSSIQGKNTLGLSVVNSSDLNAFCEHTLDDVYRYALRLTGGNPTQTADLVQDTYTTLLHHVNAHPVDHVQLPWLITCCRHRHLDTIKKRDRRERNQRRAWRPTRADPVNDHGDLIDALAHLDPIERTAVVLRHVDELPIADIADLIGKTVAATDSLLRRGRERLRTHYLHTRKEQTGHDRYR